MDIPAASGQRGLRPADVITCADVRPLHDAFDAAGAADATPELPRQLDAPIAALCTRARGAGLRIEEALVEVKRAWREIPGSQRFEAPSHRDARLDRIVTAFIAHYFERP